MSTSGPEPVPSQTTSGKAFEFAIVHGLQAVMSGRGPCRLVNSPALTSASLEFASLGAAQQGELMMSAVPAASHLLHLEPVLAKHTENSSPLLFSLQADQAGAEGDVRDVIITNSQGFEIGISAKHQHEAVKHSRLSQKIDFGDRWLGMPCSARYFEEVTPVFQRLSALKEKGALWSSIEDKEDSVYGCLLRAFRQELLRLDRLNPGLVAGCLAGYLIGKKDFYKVMKFPQFNKIQVFNFNGTLNAAHGSLKPRVHLDRLKKPRRIVELAFKLDEAGAQSLTTLELICDGGWQISFRIHNASSRVEPSLKFDIGLVGRPNSLPTFHVLSSELL